MGPENLDISLELSPTVRERLTLLVEEILKHLRVWNVKYEKVESIKV